MHGVMSSKTGFEMVNQLVYFEITQNEIGYLSLVEGVEAMSRYVWF